ncbi:hypothetical protein B2J93_1354 [Marssonina coronariae]|uniref:Isopenicillin N synthase-like Fe(2+) 2OG dioxygenase domain-containing protein n=1 Tax=Diplocarpon coronariae TaxID=2795749 RepID=A0A218ZB41_9HELO|nr:hypothetical protein B2J93_1354 [Marssonina coronariae]
MAAPFAPPSATGKPQVPTWVPPQPTRMPLEWADLRTIELSLLDAEDPAVVAALVATTKAAIKEDGFLFLTNYGVSLEQLHRQFSLAQYLHSNISDEEKQSLLWDPSTGREKGKYDGIEHFNFYSPEFADQDRVPECIRPFMDELTAFCDYLVNSVNRRLLRLLSMVLELPEDYLWDNVQSHDGLVGDGYFRHALYYPLEEEVRASRKGVRMYGHTDYGTTTLLFSVPVTALQIWKNDTWRYVKYKPGALVINLGENLEVISGGHFKATLHKVADPPEDQRHEQRLSLVLFNGSKGDMRLKPVTESPLIQREGFVLSQGVFMQFKNLMDSGIPVPTSKEWREAQIRTRMQIPPEERLDGIKEVNGTKYSQDRILGVPIMLPV